MSAVGKLKGPVCDDNTEETEKDAEVEKSDYVDDSSILSHFMPFQDIE